VVGEGKPNRLAVSLSKPRAVEQVPLLRADPHRWGAGLVHLIDEERDQTWCGKSPGGCPGKLWGPREAITCKSCLRSIATRAQAEERRREWEQRERQLAENNRLCRPTTPIC
jgi:hypothetical protein